MSKTFEKAVIDNMANFTMELHREFPAITGFGYGLIPGYEFDSTVSEEEKSKKAEDDSTFIISTVVPLSEDMKREIRKRLSEKFFQFFNVSEIST